METLEMLKRRMHTAESLRDLVRTMKSLAAVSLRHYEHVVAALADYDRTVELGLRAVFRRAPPPSARERPSDQRAVVVLGSDQGLCGTFNEQVVRRLLEDLDDVPGPGPVRLFAVGGRAAAGLTEAGLPPEGEAPLPVSAALLPQLVQDLLVRIDGWLASGDVGRVDLYYNRPLGAGGSRPHRQTLLPITAEWLHDLAREPWPTRMLPLHSANRAVLLGGLTRQHLFVTLHRALAWSLASEHASRLVVMQAAERNIDERLEDLRMQYHGWRQTAITTELLDIVSGVEALADTPA